MLISTCLMRKLRLARGTTADKWLCWDSNSGSLTAEPWLALEKQQTVGEEGLGCVVPQPRLKVSTGENRVLTALVRVPASP